MGSKGENRPPREARKKILGNNKEPREARKKLGKNKEPRKKLVRREKIKNRAKRGGNFWEQIKNRDKSW